MNTVIEEIESFTLLKERIEAIISELNDIFKTLELKVNNPDFKEKKIQLQAINKSITDIEKTGYKAPDSLRQIKTTLICEIDSVTKAQELLDIISETTKPFSISTYHERSIIRQTTKLNPNSLTSIFKKWLIEALENLDGAASSSDVYKYILEHHHAEIQTELFERNSRNMVKWQQSVLLTVSLLKKQNIFLSKTSPGYWALNKARNEEL